MAPQKTQRPTRAEINLDNLAFNFNSVKEFVGPEIRFMAVVKADGYGHGAVECARKLEAEGIDWFGVALPEEGVELRKAGITKRILCLGGFWEGQEIELLNHNLTPVIFQLRQAERFNRAAMERGTAAEIHVKIDTGMNRIGVRHDEVESFAGELKRFKNLHLEGLMTHFASADDLRENPFTTLQIDLFEDSHSIFKKCGFNPVYLDLANSPASVAHPRSYGNMVRLGGVLYGLGDDVLPKGIDKPVLKPVMSLRTRIAHIKRCPKGETLGYGRIFRLERDSVIATIPIGYQDGYSRSLSNKARTIINGTYAPVAGRISMDWTIVDVTDVPNVQIDDEVVLMGESADLSITAEDLASATDTISYEITCGISKRVERRIIDSGTA